MAKFNPIYSITNSIANNLLEIERIKEGIKALPINPKLLSSLRETAKVATIHYSTQIKATDFLKKMFLRSLRKIRLFQTLEEYVMRRKLEATMQLLITLKNLPRTNHL